jgi:hypothetical protein
MLRPYSPNPSKTKTRYFLWQRVEKQIGEKAVKFNQNTCCNEQPYRSDYGCCAKKLKERALIIHELISEVVNESSNTSVVKWEFLHPWLLIHQKPIL